MALSRLMIVIHPMDTMFKHNRFVLHCTGTLLGISLFCSTGFTIILEVTSHTIPTVLCSPFFDPTDSILVIKVIIWIVVVLQLSALLLIILTYTKLIIELEKSQKDLPQLNSNVNSNAALITQRFPVAPSI